jgi:hypothetical protein
LCARKDKKIGNQMPRERIENKLIWKLLHDNLPHFEKQFEKINFCAYVKSIKP